VFSASKWSIRAAILGHFLNLKISVITAVFNLADTVAVALAGVHRAAIEGQAGSPDNQA